MGSIKVQENWKLYIVFRCRYRLCCSAVLDCRGAVYVAQGPAAIALLSLWAQPNIAKTINQAGNGLAASNSKRSLQHGDDASSVTFKSVYYFGRTFSLSVEMKYVTFINGDHQNLSFTTIRFWTDPLLPPDQGIGRGLVILAKQMYSEEGIIFQQYHYLLLRTLTCLRNSHRYIRLFVVRNCDHYYCDPKLRLNCTNRGGKLINIYQPY